MRPEPPARFRPTLLERLGLQRLVPPAWRIIIRQLERKPVHAFFSCLGIALAVAILILGRYFEDALDRIVEVQFDIVQREDLSLVFHEPRPARARHDLARLPGVLRVEPFRQVPVRLRFGHRSHRTVLIGLGAGGQFRRLVDRRLKTHPIPPAGVVLTTALAEMLGIRPGQTLEVAVLEGERPVRWVRLQGTVDELVGVAAYMDLRVLHRLLREGETLSGAYLGIDPAQASTLYATLKQLPAVAGVTQRQAALSGFQETVAKSLGIFTTILVVFACIIAFGVVYNAARVALSERARDLASLRVLGFTRAEVAVILLGEQALLTALAIPLGFVLGWAFSALMPLAYRSELYRLPYVVNRTTYAFAFVVVAAAACLSGLVVRRHLDHLDLIAVLKTRE